MVNLMFLIFSLFSGNDSVRAVQITQLFPYLDSNGQFTAFDTLKMRLFYYQDMQAIQIPIDRNNALYYYEYFISHKDSAFGYTYGKYDSPKLKDRYRSRSNFIAEDTWLNYIYGYHAFQDNIMTLVHTEVDAGTGNLTEVYTGYAKNDTSGKGTIYYTYTSGMRDIPFTLSSQLDSIKQMKLINIRIVHHPAYVKQYNRNVGEFEGSYNLEYFSVKPNHEIFGYFKRYKEDIQRPLL